MSKKKSKFFYDSVEDSHRRLGGTVVVFKGLPTYINSVSGLNTDQQAEIHQLPFRGGKSQLVPLTSELFSVRNLPPLGYVDYKRFSHYACRIPSRQSKQGYCRTNVQVSANPDGDNPDFNTLMELPSLINMFQGKYPSLSSAFEELLGEEEPLKRSISRTTAIWIDDAESVTLEYRSVKVGVANNPKKYGPLFRLPQKYSYLKEEMNELGIKIET